MGFRYLGLQVQDCISIHTLHIGTAVVHHQFWQWWVHERVQCKLLPFSGFFHPLPVGKMHKSKVCLLGVVFLVLHRQQTKYVFRHQFCTASQIVTGKGFIYLAMIPLNFRKIENPGFVKLHKTFHPVEAQNRKGHFAL